MVKEFAEYLSLTVWDWIAVIIALCSFIIASMSFVIARKTLLSQRQTEMNTMPIVNLDVQEFLLCEFITKLFDGHLMITALWYLLNENNYKSYPSEQILENLKISSSYIHVELFYNEPAHFRTIEGIVDMVREYNVSISTLNNHLQRVKIPEEILYREFEKLIHINDRIANTWCKLMHLLFNYDVSARKKIIEPFINDITQDDIENCKLKYYNQDEVYTLFTQNEYDKRRLLTFMQLTTSKYYDDIINLQINK